MKWTINVNRLPLKVAGLNYSIDSPKRETVNLSDTCSLNFSGWIFVEGIENLHIVFDFDPKIQHKLNVNRPGVAQKFIGSPLMCGFSRHIPNGRNFKFGVYVNGVIEWVASITFERVRVLEGRDGYLFLDHDANKSLQQYNGIEKIDKVNINSWFDYFSKLNKIKCSSNFKHVFLLAPAKEFIYPDFYPAWRQGTTPVDQFLTLFSEGNNIIYPVGVLIDQRNYSYPKMDTHWTDYGAGIVAELVCDKLGVHFNDSKVSYEFLRIAGDLGGKFIPPRSEVIPCVNFNFINKYLAFHNNINNRGGIRIFSNPDATEKNTCVVFGDSFSNRLVNFLVLSFQRVVHVFSGADIDFSILSHENPAYVLTEIATRFLIKAPDVDYSIKNDISRKAKYSSSLELEKLTANMERYASGEQSFYAELTLQGLAIQDK